MISTKGRYALRVILDLAQQEDDGFLSLKGIAQRQGISQKYLEMIVAILQKAEIVVSQRGKEGGYRLQKAPNCLTVGEVIKVMEGSLAPVACLEGEENVCVRAKECLTLPMCQRLDTMIDQYLNSITIQDLLDGNLV